MSRYSLLFMNVSVVCHTVNRIGGSVVKNLPANARDVGLIPGSGRFPGEGSDNPLQYSRLDNPIDRGIHGGLKELDRMK